MLGEETIGFQVCLFKTSTPDILVQSWPRIGIAVTLTKLVRPLNICSIFIFAVARISPDSSSRSVRLLLPQEPKHCSCLKVADRRIDFFRVKMTKRQRIASSIQEGAVRD